MSKAIICPHCGSSRLDIKDSKKFYQCRDCDVYIDTQTVVSKAVDKTNSLISGLAKFGLLILAVDDADNIVDLIENLID